MDREELTTPAIRQALERLSVANVSDAMHGYGTLRGPVPIDPSFKVFGPAFPVFARSGDWLNVTKAIDLAAEGDVLVVDGGTTDAAVWGELAAYSAVSRKLAGAVINGAARDVHEIKKIGFPLFCTAAVPRALRPQGRGELGKKVIIGGVVVSKGDWILGDSSGVVCIPARSIDDVLPTALSILEQEERIRDKINKGSTLWQEMESYWEDQLSNPE